MSASAAACQSAAAENTWKFHALFAIFFLPFIFCKVIGISRYITGRVPSRLADWQTAGYHGLASECSGLQCWPIFRWNSTVTLSPTIELRQALLPPFRPTKECAGREWERSKQNMQQQVHSRKFTFMLARLFPSSFDSCAMIFFSRGDVYGIYPPINISNKRKDYSAKTKLCRKI